MINPAITSRKRMPAAHGGGVRGDNSTPRSTLFEGRFGRMFRSLPAAEWHKDALRKLAGEKVEGSKAPVSMMADPETDENDKTLPSASREKDDLRIQDDEENAGISAGYTYL